MTETRELIRHILVDVFDDVLGLQEKYLKSHGVPLTINEVHTLEAILKAGDNNRMSDIADSLDITLSTFSINIKRLINKGYVERVADDVDRRIGRLSLTENAAKAIEVHELFHDQLVDSLFADLAIGDDKFLIESLVKIDNHFKKMKKEYSSNNR